MIDWCLAISLHEADIHASRRSPISGWKGRVAWIGIEPWPSPLRYNPQREQLILSIPDSVAAQDAPDPRAGVTGRELPTLEQAMRIVEFTRALQASPQSYALIVHCTMGISRSTAVCLWARKKYKVTKPDISPYEPGWNPNPTLYRFLEDAWRIT